MRLQMIMIRIRVRRPHDLLFSTKSARVRQCESEVLFRMLPGNV